MRGSVCAKHILAGDTIGAGAAIIFGIEVRAELARPLDPPMLRNIELEPCVAHRAEACVPTPEREARFFA
jgi:hypothetical protein